jgi:hypothetical protein
VDLAFVDVIAYEVLDVAAEPFSDLQQQSFGLVVLGEFGGVAGVDEILQFVALHEFVSAHEVKVDLVLFVPAQQELPKDLHLR